MAEEFRTRPSPDPGKRRAPGFVDVVAPRKKLDSLSEQPPLTPAPPPSRGPGIRGGIVAGVAAGLVTGLGVTAWTVVRGAALWRTTKMVSAPFFGERALDPAFDAGPILVGAVTHLVVCAGWGALFGAVFYGTTRGATVAFGALWGLVVWLAMHYGLLPLVGVANLASAVPIALAISGHVLFGLLLGLAFLPFQRVRWPLDWTA